MTHLSISEDTNRVLDTSYIPDSVTHFTFDDIYDTLNCRLPDSVTHLTFGVCYNQPLYSGAISNNITHLTFGDDFNQPLESGHIPDSVIHLIFGFDFNQPLEPGHIPASVTHLIFGHKFNKPLEPGHIPDSVTYLAFGDNFNQKLKAGDIPDGVTHLSFQHYRQILKKEAIPLYLEAVTCRYDKVITCLTNMPLHIKVYITDTNKHFRMWLSVIRHLVYLESGEHDDDIINGRMDMHYLDTVEENGKKYLVVHGDDYIPYSKAKSARK